MANLRVFSSTLGHDLAEFRMRAAIAGASNPGLGLFCVSFWPAITLFLSPGAGAAGWAICLALLFGASWRRFFVGALSSLALAAGFALTQAPFLHPQWAPVLRGITEEPKSCREGAPLQSIGRVAAFPVSGARDWRFPLRTENGTWLIRLPKEIQPPEPGARIRIVGVCKPPRPAANPGAFDATRYFRSQAWVGGITAQGYNAIEPPGLWQRWVTAARRATDAALLRHVPAAGLPLVRAAVLGITEGVDEASMTAFLDSGLIHILAISGQHLGLILLVLLEGGKLIRLPKKATYAAAAAITAVYVPMTGAPVPVLRSAAMFACFTWATLRERPYPARHALYLSGAFCLWLNPLCLLQTGYQLSFAATWALFHFGEASSRCAHRLRCGQGLRAAVFHTLFLGSAVSLTLHPLLSHATQVTSPLSPLANLPALPLGSGMLVSALLCLVAAPLAACAGALPFADFPADAFGMGASALAVGLEAVVQFCAGVPGAVVANPPIPPHALLLWGVGLACAPLVRSHRLARRGMWLVGAAASALFFFSAGKDGLRPPVAVHFFAVGHGDAALLRVPGADFLIDAGPGHGEGVRTLLPGLRRMGVHALHTVFITHGDADHVAGLSGLLGKIPIRHLAAPKNMDGSGPFRRCLDRAEAMSVPLLELSEGDRLYSGPAGNLRVLAPGSAQSGFDRNDRSLVLLWEGEGGRWVFTGDLEKPGQAALCPYRPLLAGSLVKMPHHGSDRTTAPEFIRDLQPRLAVISTGRRPGFPGKRVMALLDSLRVPTHVTEAQGAWTWRAGEPLPLSLQTPGRARP